MWVPSESGPSYARRRGLDRLQRRYDPKIRETRAKYILELVLRHDASAGIVGEDIYDSWRFETNNVSPDLTTQPLRLRYTGPYQDAVTGLPMLAVLGDEGTVPRQGAKFQRGEPHCLDGKRVAYPSLYGGLLQRICDSYQSGLWLGLPGQVDTSLAQTQKYDYAIDVVNTGGTACRNDLKVVSALYESDGLILYGSRLRKNALRGF